MPETLIQDAKNIKLNTHNEVDQILGRPPGWILRWGISLVFITVMIFLLMAWSIKFPDTVPIAVTVQTENPAIRIITETEGRIESLLVKDQQYIEKGTIVATLEGPIAQQSIKDLENWLSMIEQVSFSDYTQLDNTFPALTLGDLEPQYASIVQKVQDYQYHLNTKLPGVLRKISVLNDQIDAYKEINQTLSKQHSTLNVEVGIAKRNFKRNQQLNSQGAISDLALEEIEKENLQYQRQLESFETQMVGNKILVEQLELQIIDLKQNQNDELKAKELSIQEGIQSLKAQIKLWKRSYQVVTPISGKVSLSSIWSPNQYVEQGQEVMTIVPTEGAGSIVVRAKLPTVNSGKVKNGQTVNIRLNGFPYQEFGIVKATVKRIALVPESNVYNLDLELTNGLVTTYEKQIKFQQEMEGTADIITEDRRILERVFDRIWSLIKNI